MGKEKTSPQNVVQLFVQTSHGDPVSFKLDLSRTTKLISLISLVVLALFWGTLLFFRELETNRKLQAEVLETHLKLQLQNLSNPELSSPNRQLGYTVNLTEDEALKKSISSEDSLNSNSASTGAKDFWLNLSGSTVAARLGSLSSECQTSNCVVKIELLPAGNGISQGELLIVLETEVPRIGSRGISIQQRKQFILYPGYYSREELNNSDISVLEKRPFKFSKTLNASLNFKVTKLLRPLAVNVYLFDSRKNLTHHERKPIDLDDNYAN